MSSKAQRQHTKKVKRTARQESTIAATSSVPSVDRINRYHSALLEILDLTNKSRKDTVGRQVNEIAAEALQPQGGTP